MGENLLEVLLVGLVVTVGVADLLLKVGLLGEDIVADTGHVGVLEVSVEVDLDDTMADGGEVLLLGGAGSSVEDKEQGLVLGALDLVLGVGLVGAEKLGVELDVSGLVNTVHVTEAGSDGEVGGDGSERLVDIVDVLGLGVEGGIVDISVVNTILLTSSDSDLLRGLLAMRGS